jgi:hypothetical protein
MSDWSIADLAALHEVSQIALAAVSRRFVMHRLTHQWLLFQTGGGGCVAPSGVVPMCDDRRRGRGGRDRDAAVADEPAARVSDGLITDSCLRR